MEGIIRLIKGENGVFEGYFYKLLYKSQKRDKKEKS